MSKIFKFHNIQNIEVIEEIFCKLKNKEASFKNTTQKKDVENINLLRRYLKNTNIFHIDRFTLARKIYDIIEIKHLPATVQKTPVIDLLLIRILL